MGRIIVLSIDLFRVLDVLSVLSLFYKCYSLILGNRIGRARLI